MTSINSEPAVNHVAVDVNYHLFDNDTESNEVITAGEYAFGIAAAIWLIIILTGLTIGLLYAGGIL
jgi:hypothetical protein